MKPNNSIKEIKQSPGIRIGANQIVVWTLLLLLSCNSNDKPSKQFMRESIKAQLENPKRNKTVISIDFLEGKSGDFKATDGTVLPGYSIAFNADLDIDGEAGSVTKIIAGFAKKSNGEWKLVVIDWGMFRQGGNSIQLIE